MPMSLMHPIWSRRHRRAGPSTLNSRIEVCPPALWPSSVTLWGRLQRWLNSAPLGWPQASQPVNRLAKAREDFLSALRPLSGDEAQLLCGRIERARSLRELWHLRSSLYGQLSLQCSQLQAEQQLAQLNRHFPTRAPRSSLAPLNS
ncbi:MAG: hypothetical protein ACKVQR_17310 [Aquabacterium sp.]